MYGLGNLQCLNHYSKKTHLRYAYGLSMDALLLVTPSVLLIYFYPIYDVEEAEFRFWSDIVALTLSFITFPIKSIIMCILQICF